jgi:hypothetical protein
MPRSAAEGRRCEPCPLGAGNQGKSMTILRETWRKFQKRQLRFERGTTRESFYPCIIPSQRSLRRFRAVSGRQAQPELRAARYRGRERHFPPARLAMFLSESTGCDPERAPDRADAGS